MRRVQMCTDVTERRVLEGLQEALQERLQEDQKPRSRRRVSLTGVLAVEE